MRYASTSGRNSSTASTTSWFPLADAGKPAPHRALAAAGPGPALGRSGPASTSPTLPSTSSPTRPSIRLMALAAEALLMPRHAAGDGSRRRGRHQRSKLRPPKGHQLVTRTASSTRRRSAGFGVAATKVANHQLSAVLAMSVDRQALRAPLGGEFRQNHNPRCCKFDFGL